MIGRTVEKANNFSSSGDRPSIPGERTSFAYKVVLAIRLPGPVQIATARHEDLLVDAYPVLPHLILRCTGPEDALEETERLIESSGILRYGARGNGQRTLFLEGGQAEERLIALVQAHSADLVPPISYRGGEARVTLVAEEATDVRDLTEIFPGGRLLSKRALSNVSMAREALGSPLFLPQLTEKQATALLAAFDAGYYEYPRRVTSEDVGNALGVARSTFQEHLSKAEQHVVRATLPLIRMRAASSQAGVAHAEALAIYSRFSRELGLYVRLEILGGLVSGVRLTHEPSEAKGSHPYLTRILDHVRTGTGDLSDIPLRLEVTPFERRVLEFLRTLPTGETITYGEIARRLGKSGAARAVGRAVANNPIPVVIPCHRVLPATGGLGGYSGGDGPETKRKLLEREGALASPGVTRRPPLANRSPPTDGGRGARPPAVLTPGRTGSKRPRGR